MATKKKVNAREARREAALAQIVDGMAGAFGDYVRAQMAQRPQAAPQAQPLMGMRGPMPPGDGTGGPQMPMYPPSPPPAGDGTMGATPPDLVFDIDQRNRNPYLGGLVVPPLPWGGAPGFDAPNVPATPQLPGREVTFEDGSTAIVGGGFDPGFFTPNMPPRIGAPLPGSVYTPAVPPWLQQIIDMIPMPIHIPSTQLPGPPPQRL